jgi:hypothetical protein
VEGRFVETKLGKHRQSTKSKRDSRPHEAIVKYSKDVIVDNIDGPVLFSRER